MIISIISTAPIAAEATSLSVPRNVKLVSQPAGITVRFSRVNKAKKYNIQYSTSKKFHNSKTVTVTSTKKTIKKLKCDKKYYVRVRSCRGKKHSNWSKPKSVYTKLTATAVNKKIINKGYWVIYSPQSSSADVYTFWDYDNGHQQSQFMYVWQYDFDGNCIETKYDYKFKTYANKVKLGPNYNYTWIYNSAKKCFYLTYTEQLGNDPLRTVRLRVFRYKNIPTPNQMKADSKKR